LQKCTIKAALLGLSIALLGPTTGLTSPQIQTTRPEVTRSDAQVGSASNALTQETRARHQSATRSSVTNTYIARTSWYRHGTITANGERYNPMGLTVAHKTLPFNTMVKFTNPSNGNTVVVRVNDRGPMIRGREFDLSMRAAQLLGMIDRGVVNLVVEIIMQETN
jgi:rare lipoprotein A